VPENPLRDCRHFVSGEVPSLCWAHERISPHGFFVQGIIPKVLGQKLAARREPPVAGSNSAEAYSHGGPM